MDWRPPPLLSASPSSQQSFPPSLPGGSGGGSCRWQTPVLRRSGTATRPTSFCPLSGPMEKERLGGLRQGSLWRTATGAGVSGPLYPSRGHFQSPPAEVGRWPSLLPVERLPRQADAKGDGCLRGRVHSPLPAACASARLPTYSLLRLPGQLPPRRQTGSLPPAAGNGVLPAAPSACRLPRFSCGAHRRQVPALSAMWHLRADADANIPAIPAISRPHSAPRGQLMMPRCRNPQSPQRCLPGRVHSTCVPHRPQRAGTPFPTPSSFSSPLHLHTPSRHRLAKPLLAHTSEAPHIFPAAKTPSLAAEQNPLNTGRGSKV